MGFTAKTGSRGLFIASTGQHIGKTTTSLGLFSGLLKRASRTAFIKPVGQEHVDVGAGVRVDKDSILFRLQFDLQDSWEAMSPVLFPRGFTRDYIDGTVETGSLEQKIVAAYRSLQVQADWVLAEGTGHVGVGSIADLDNARVAQLLGTPMVMIASGGLGSAFDSLALNKYACDRLNVPIAGVILNRVLPEKREMIIDYMGRALGRWGVPLLGAIPYDTILGHPCMDDFERLFEAPILTGETHRYRHFDQVRLVATSNEVYEQHMEPRQLTITPARREDIIETTLVKLDEARRSGMDPEPLPGMILTGRYEPDEAVLRRLAAADVPMIYAPVNTFVAMQMISRHTAKIRVEDTEKVSRAIHLVETHVDLDALMDRVDAVV
ncbi:MAG: cobyrinic acid a,c-diamide synthase [Spirochaetaceae bacterium]|nr:MAG: cobyrinic acid a,c-diamide synthase [Spirochaetaceae bacterium]